MSFEFDPNSAEDEYFYAEKKGWLRPFYNEWFRARLNPHKFVLRDGENVVVDADLCRLPDGKQLLISLDRDESLGAMSEESVRRMTPKELFITVWTDIKSKDLSRFPLELTLSLGNIFMQELKQFQFWCKIVGLEHVSDEYDDDESSIGFMSPNMVWPTTWKNTTDGTTTEGFLLPNRPRILSTLLFRITKKAGEPFPIKEG